MALVDYKIKSFSHEGRRVSVTVGVYRGAFQDVEIGTPSAPETVNVYVRTNLLATRSYQYTVPRDMTRQEFLIMARGYLNDKLLTWASANGHTVIDQQQDTSQTEVVAEETTP